MMQISAFRRAAPLLLAALTTGALPSCEPKIDDCPTASAGPLDLSRYVALGDDFTAGAANEGLTPGGQAYSFPALLARQFQQAGGGAFRQPLLAAGTTTGGYQLVGLTALNQALLGAVLPTPFLDSAQFGAGTLCAATRYRLPAWDGAGPLPNNLGAPGLRVVDVETPGLGDDAALRVAGAPYNAYLERVLADNADARSYLTLARQANPTFLTVSIGLSDVLPFVLSGGTCNPPPAQSLVGARAARLVDSLVATTSARGIVLSAPDLTALPLTRTRISDINLLLGRGATDTMYVRNAGGVVVVASSADIVLLPIVGRVGRLETADGQPASFALGLDARNPLRDQDVLSSQEISLVTGILTGRNGLNDQLMKRAVASGGRFVFLDVNSLFLDMAIGRYIDGVRYSGDPVTGGLFTYDGHTLSPRGNGLLVNRVITALNNTNPVEGFSAKLLQVDINSLPPTPVP